MKVKNLQKKKGFVILFAVTISAILLAIALGVANIAVKEVKFTTNARDTNDAFFAADTGAECALFNDKFTVNSFPQSGGPTSIQCAGLTINFTTGLPSWNFIISGLGSGQSCAKVNIVKTFSPNTTNIISKGYNDGGALCVQGSNSVERQIEVNY